MTLAERQNTILVVGASSDIAKALCHLYASKGHDLVIAGRNIADLEKDAADYSIRHQVAVKVLELDVCATQKHHDILKSILPDCVGLISVAGYLGDTPQALQNWNEAERILHTNFTGLVSILNLAATCFAERKSGWIVGISSVAGDRGRQSNFLYGAAKGGFSTYLAGLRNWCFHRGVHVLTVKPGFVDTKMTAELDLPKPLTAKPEQVAKKIFQAQQAKRNTLYVLWMWKWIMLIIRNIPESLFKKRKM